MEQNAIKLNAIKLSLLPKEVKFSSYESFKRREERDLNGITIQSWEAFFKDKISFGRPDSRRTFFRQISVFLKYNTQRACRKSD